MSANAKKIFNFSRKLPEPFRSSEKKVNVSSVYGSKTEATLNCSVIKAVNAVCGCMDGTGEGAVGDDGKKCMAEYKSAMGPDTYHLAVYDGKNGNVMAGIYDKVSEVSEVYTVNRNKMDGAAVIMAMFPALMEDREFRENFEKYHAQYTAGYPDKKETVESMGILCDNAYRRVIDDSCPAHLELKIDQSGNLARVSQSQIDSGSYTPTEVVAGEFTIFANTAQEVVKKAGKLVERKDFVVVKLFCNILD